MKIRSLLENSKPTSYAAIKRNAEAVAKNAFYVYLKKTPNEKSDIYYYNDSFAIQRKLSKDLYEKFAKEEFAADKNVDLNQVETKEIDTSKAQFDDEGNLIDNDDTTQTYSQRISTFVANERQVEEVLSSNVTTVANIRNQLQGDNYKTGHQTLLDSLISNAGQEFQEINLGEINKKTQTAVLVEFGEVAGPVGLVCQSINGSGARLLPYFLSDDKKPVGLKDLIKNSTIHFNPNETARLVDSYIEYQGKVVRISSKAAGTAISGGGGASLTGVIQSLTEISGNPQARDQFNKLIKKPDYAKAYRYLKLLSTGEESNIERSIILLNEVYNTDIINENDKLILSTLYELAGSETRLSNSEFSILLGTALENPVDQFYYKRKLSTEEAYQKFNQLQNKTFSQGFKDLLVKFNPNKLGEPQKTKSVNIDREENSLSNLKSIKKGIIYAIAVKINAEPAFSNLCTWILNHGSFMQVDLAYDTDDDKNIVVTNIVATWPSQTVDRVILQPVSQATRSSFKLLVNQNRMLPPDQAAKLSKDDFNFGFNIDRETLEKLIKPTAADLKRSLPGDKRTRTTRQSNVQGILNSFFDKLNDKLNVEKTNELQRQEFIAKDLSKKIIQKGYMPEVLELLIKEFNRQLYAYSYLAEADDDDDEEDEDSSSDEISDEKYTEVKNVAQQINKLLYSSFFINSLFKNNLASSEEYQDVKQQLLDLDIVRSDAAFRQQIEQAISTREQGQEPEYYEPEYVPPNNRKVSAVFTALTDLFGANFDENTAFNQIYSLAFDEPDENSLAKVDLALRQIEQANTVNEAIVKPKDLSLLQNIYQTLRAAYDYVKDKSQENLDALNQLLREVFPKTYAKRLKNEEIFRQAQIKDTVLYLIKNLLNATDTTTIKDAVKFITQIAYGSPSAQTLEQIDNVLAQTSQYIQLDENSSDQNNLISDEFSKLKWTTLFLKSLATARKFYEVKQQAYQNKSEELFDEYIKLDDKLQEFIKSLSDTAFKNKEIDIKYWSDQKRAELDYAIRASKRPTAAQQQNAEEVWVQRITNARANNSPLWAAFSEIGKNKKAEFVTIVTDKLSENPGLSDDDIIDLINTTLIESTESKKLNKSNILNGIEKLSQQQDQELDNYLIRFVPRDLDAKQKDQVMHWLKREYTQRPLDFSAKARANIKSVISAYLSLGKNINSVTNLDEIRLLVNNFRHKVNHRIKHSGRETEQVENQIRVLSKPLNKDCFLFSLSDFDDNELRISQLRGDLLADYAGFEFDVPDAELRLKRKKFGKGIFAVLLNFNHPDSSTDFYIDLENKKIYAGNRLENLRLITTTNLNRLITQENIKIGDYDQLKSIYFVVNTIQRLFQQNKISQILDFVNISDDIKTDLKESAFDESDLDQILANLLQTIQDKIQANDNKLQDLGLVGAAIVAPDYEPVYAIGYQTAQGTVHGERAVLERWLKKHKTIPERAVLVTTLSPCVNAVENRKGCSCAELIKRAGIKHVHTAVRDHTQPDCPDFKTTYSTNASITPVAKLIGDYIVNTVKTADHE